MIPTNYINFWAVVATVVLTLSTCHTFKLPLEVSVKDTLDPCMDMKIFGESDRIIRNKGEINSIQPRRRLEFQTNNERPYPVTSSYSNQGHQLVGDRFANYGVESLRRLERFYKHVSTPPRTRSAERIIFPSDDLNPSSSERPINTDADSNINNSSGENRSPELSPSYPYYPSLSLPTTEAPTNRTNLQYEHSLESLAQIVRHLLFRMPVRELPVASSGIADTITTPDNYYDIEEAETTSNPISFAEPSSQSTSSSELDVRDQSLYSGPKLRSTSNGDCPEGFKKTRNGSCQKPSRRFFSS